MTDQKFERDADDVGATRIRWKPEKKHMEPLHHQIRRLETQRVLLRLQHRHQHSTTVSAGSSSRRYTRRLHSVTYQRQQARRRRQAPGDLIQAIFISTLFALPTFAFTPREHSVGPGRSLNRLSLSSSSSSTLSAPTSTAWTSNWIPT
ncbi:hypothetical protein D9619_009497 [Psilocybe cf. subviscida]|uniref:Uncharacterized protein n=1 Tax=Psilocybe cf. subviscida TaxID=2480587 RepID=A0A8H5BUE4_9AGAR|nr:hypothetical protein D9619_009497 [Psilocybe cf. subviscida]